MSESENKVKSKRVRAHVYIKTDNFGQTFGREIVQSAHRVWKLSRKVGKVPSKIQ